MRIAGWLAVGALVAGMIVAGGVTAPASQAATATGSSPPARAVSATRSVPVTALAASRTARPARPAGVRSRWAELANAATGANLWSRSSVQERPMGSVAKVMTAYVVLSTPG